MVNLLPFTGVNSIYTYWIDSSCLLSLWIRPS